MVKYKLSEWIGLFFLQFSKLLCGRIFSQQSYGDGVFPYMAANGDNSSSRSLYFRVDEF